MTRIAIALLFAVTGCRTTHLGADTGVAYRAAFDAQRRSDPERTPTFGADDAKLARARARGEGTKPAAAPASASILMPAPTTASGNSGAWQGATGKMSLEAK